MYLGAVLPVAVAGVHSEHLAGLIGKQKSLDCQLLRARDHPSAWQTRRVWWELWKPSSSSHCWSQGKGKKLQALRWALFHACSEVQLLAFSPARLTQGGKVCPNAPWA